MRHVVHFVVMVVALGVVGIAVGCASAIDVDIIDRERLSQAHTWAFLGRDPAIQLSSDGGSPGFTYRVTSPMHNAADLDADLARYIERALEARGLEQAESDADLYVDYQLTLEPRIERVEVGFAQRYVPSFSHTNSYTVEGTSIEERVFRDLRLAIDLRDHRGQVLWRGEVDRRLSARDALALEAQVDDLIHRIPSKGD